MRAHGAAALVSARLDDTELPLPADGAALTIDTATLPDGPHRLRLAAEDRSLRRNRSVLDLSFTTDNTPPAIEVTPLAFNERLRAGQAVALRVGVSEPAELRAEWNGSPAPLIQLPGATGAQLTRLALLAAPVTATASVTQLSVSARDSAGNGSTHRAELPVEVAPAPRQNLLVPPALAGLATGPVALEEGARLAALTSPVRVERLWSGEFRTPLAGPRTTGFGDRRDYADGHVAAHAGYDVAAPDRSPVLAAAAGVVTHTGPFPQRGATVVLDHGWGVYTVYSHLSEIQAVAGQPVAQGQAVGLVGSTGLSTGPHLHWEVRLRGQPVDPDGWIALSRTLR